MKIWVEHEIPEDEKYCMEFGKGGWRTLCRYLKSRDRHGKRGTPIQRNLPRCTLFNEWLEKDMHVEIKCEQCKQACSEGVE